MKRSIPQVLSLFLCLSLLIACGGAFAFADAEEPAGSFDQDLVGAWNYTRSETNGKEYLAIEDVLSDLDFFLPDGTVSAGTFAFLTLNGLEQPVAEAADGKTNLGEALPAFIETLAATVQAALESGTEVEGIDADTLAAMCSEFSKCRDLEISYELRDLDLESVNFFITDNEKAAYQENTKDELLIHITGVFKEDPLSSTPIDSTLFFVREYTFDEWFEALLCGSWSDNNGNTWEFRYEQDERGSITLTGSLTDPSGSVYEASDFSFVREEVVPSDSGGLKTTVTFCFQDFDSPAYTVAEMDMNRLSLLSEKGDLELTRN